MTKYTFNKNNALRFIRFRRIWRFFSLHKHFFHLYLAKFREHKEITLKKTTIHTLYLQSITN